MNNKYNLTLEQNIFLAKRNLVDNVYANARMEGLNITFPETKTILEGINVPNLKIDEIQCILNLRDAWNFVLTNIDDEIITAYRKHNRCEHIKQHARRIRKALECHLYQRQRHTDCRQQIQNDPVPQPHGRDGRDGKFSAFSGFFFGLHDWPFLFLTAFLWELLISAFIVEQIYLRFVCELCLVCVQIMN